MKQQPHEWLTTKSLPVTIPGCCFALNFYMYCNSTRTNNIQCVKHTQQVIDRVAVNLHYSLTDQGKKGLVRGPTFVWGLDDKN